MTETDQRSTRLVIVNWEASVDDIVELFNRVHPNERKASLPSPDVDVPFLVRYSDSVPRDDSIVQSERYWSWAVALRIYTGLDSQSDAAP